MLAEITGGDVDGFCYPYGAVGEREVGRSRAAGYDYACAVRRPPLAGPHAMPRTYIGDRDTAPRLFAKWSPGHRLRTTGRAAMRVLHVITGLAAGGAEHQLRLLLRRLPHDECEVVTLTNPGSVADGDPRPTASRCTSWACAATTTCRALPRLRPADPGRPVRRGAHPPVPGLRVRPGRRPAGRGARTWSPPSTRSATA